MRKHLAKSVAALFLGSVIGAANATPVSPVEYHRAGLNWLVLSETTGLSISDILNGVNGWNQKFRFATDSEVLTLLNSFGLVPGYHSSWDSPEAEYIDAVGGSMPSGTAGTWFFDGSQGATARTSDMIVDVGLVDIDQGDLFGCDLGCQYVKITYAAQSVTESSPTVGNFLVEVPEPSSIGLIGVAAVALIRARRRA